MELTIIGSGTAAPEAERVGSAYFVRADGTTMLLDCGPGAVHHLARFELPWHALDHVLISHFHNDHIGDLPILLFALKWGITDARSTPLQITGPAGLADRLRHMAAAFGDHVSDPGFPVRVRELAPGDSIGAGDLRVTTVKTPHTPESLGFRLESATGSIGYTGDTGPSEDVARFFGSVDLLIAECSLPDDAPIDTHLTPARLAALATGASPRQLVVTHVYPQLEDPVERIRERGYRGLMIRAVDGLRLRTAGPAR